MLMDPREFGPTHLTRNSPLVFELTPVTIEATFVRFHQDNVFLAADCVTTANPRLNFVGRTNQNQNDPEFQPNDSRLSGVIPGCTTRVPVLGWNAENTESRFLVHHYVEWAVPNNKLTRFGPHGAMIMPNYFLRADESLVGTVTLRKFRTFNGPWVSSQDRFFGVKVFIDRNLRVIDAKHLDVVPLSISEKIFEEVLSGIDSDNLSTADSAAEVLFRIDVTNFLTSEFSYAGSGDLIIEYDYVFGANAIGRNNFVRFSGIDGSFSIRNRNVRLDSAIAVARPFFEIIET